MNYLWVSLAIAVGTTASVAAADTNPWQDIKARSAETSAVASQLTSYRLLALNEALLKTQLDNAATSSFNTQARGTTTTISLPLANGRYANVQVIPTQVLAPEIATKYPEIQTWKVVGTDNSPVHSGVLDITPQGFHAMLDMNNGETLFIDPQTTTSGERQYLSFTQQANRQAFHNDKWSCAEHGDHTDLTSINRIAARGTNDVPGKDMHTYRIAMAATGEYTQYYGSQSKAYASIVTAVNRINQVYERDLSVRLQLVSDTDVIYTSAYTDPYDNGNASRLLTQNVSNLNSVLGVGNYDIGHVMNTSAGGLASVGVVCNRDSKAQGSTGLDKPSGDAFIINYIAHEIGHQFGATHTFNGLLGSCQASNREGATAFEPGSGSTIMAYTGLCGTDDLQQDSDAMLHAATISQIRDYVYTGNGASCAGLVTLTNNNPTANAGPDYTIPANTPLLLSGSGSDTDNNTLSYSWEQMDAGTVSYANVDLSDNALIRTHLPTSSPVRTIPQMSDLVNRTASAGEYLPASNRSLNFRLQVRDGVGGTAYDDMVVTVNNTGSSFAITSPTTTSLSAGSQQTVTWNVAGTNQAPINCSAVDIAVTSDNGNSFTNLLTNTANDGSETVTLPNTLGSSSYLRVKCSNNIFFALSNTSPAKANTSNVVTTNTNTGGSVFNNDSSSGGGGGSFPFAWLLVGGLVALLRLNKGVK